MKAWLIVSLRRCVSRGKWGAEVGFYLGANRLHKSRILWCKFQSLYFIQRFISAICSIKRTQRIHSSVLSSKKGCITGLVDKAKDKYSIYTVRIKPMQNSQILFKYRPLCWVISCTFAYISGQWNDVALQFSSSSVTIWL